MTDKKETMNPVINAIHKRMSIRSYKPTSIPRDIITTIIEAGNQAPSRGREDKETKEFLFQPWRFVIVENPDFKKTLVQTTLPAWKKMTGSMKESHPEIYEQYMDSTNWRYQQPSGTGKIQPSDKKKISSSFKEDALKITIAFLVGAFLMLAFSL